MLCWFMPYNNANQNCVCVCVYVCVRACARTRVSGERNSNPLQFSGLENSMDVFLCVCVCVPGEFHGWMCVCVCVCVCVEGNSNPLQDSDLENSMDCIVHGVAKSQILLSDLHTYTHIHIYCLPLVLPGEPHGLAEPGGLQSMGWQRVGQD